MTELAQPTQKTRIAPWLDRVWESTKLKSALWVAAIICMTAPGRASAAGFESLGSRMIDYVCDFIQSPIVTVIAAVALLALLIVAGLNEDKGTMSKMLKTLIAVMAITLIPGLLTQAGFDMGC